MFKRKPTDNDYSSKVNAMFAGPVSVNSPETNESDTGAIKKADTSPESGESSMPNNIASSLDEQANSAEPESEPTDALKYTCSQDAIKTFLTMSRKKGKVSRILPPQLAHLDRHSFAWKRDWLVVIGSFLLPMIIVALAHISQGFYPFGDKSPLTVDLYHQYAPFISALRYKILHGETLWYSWQGGLGYNFFATFAYYLSSPLNFLAALIPLSALPEFVTFLQIIKIGLCGLSMALMLRIGVAQTKADKAREALLDQDSEELADLLPPGGYLNNENAEYFEDGAFCLTRGEKNARKQRYRRKEALAIARENRNFDSQNYAVFIGAILYALSGYIMSYSWNIMWLDVLAVFPLVILGVNRLINYGRFTLFALSLAACILLNYYVSFFVCLFCIVYFFFYLFSTQRGYDFAGLKKPRIALLRCFQMLFASLLAGGICAFLIWPVYEALQNTSAVKDAWPQGLNFSFSLLEFMTRHLIGSSVNIRSGLPNIYSGVPVLLALPLFVTCRKIRPAEKIAAVIVSFFLFLSFNANVLNFIWHGMHYPNQLPHRFAFVYILFMIVLLFRVFQYIKDMSAKAIAVSGGLAVINLLISEVVLSNKISHATIYLNLIFIVIYTVVLLSGANLHIPLRTCATLMVIILIGELAINTLLQTNDIAQHEYYTSSSAYTADISPVNKIVREISTDDSDFYRVAMTKRQTSDDPALYNFKGLSIFSSTVGADIAKTMRQLGYHGNNINSYIQDQATAVTDMLFGVRYLIRKETIPDNTLSRLTLNATTDLNGEFQAYKRNYDLPIGYVVDRKIVNWEPQSDSALVNQNSLLKTMTGIERPVLVGQRLTVENKDNYKEEGLINGMEGLALNPITAAGSGKAKLHLKAEMAGQLYVYVNSPAKVTVACELAKTKQGQSTVINLPQILDFGNVEKDDKVTISLTSDEKKTQKIQIWAAVMNEEALAENNKQLQDSGLKVVSYKSNQIKGTVETLSNGQLFFAIPYDNNWQVKLDGHIQPAVKAAGGFLSVAVNSGKHEVELEYLPRNFNYGAIISASSIVILLIASIISASIRKRREEEE